MPVGAPDFMKNDTSPPCAPERIANLLIVDDSAAHLQLLARLFKPGAFKVRPVPSGELALQAARQDPPDLILLDINMPGMNGIDLATIVKERRPEARIALVTANVQAALRKRAAELGIGFIDKPINESKIAAFITGTEPAR